MGTWVHWVLYNIPITAHGWPENTPDDAELVNGAMQGKNSGGEIGYGGHVRHQEHIAISSSFMRSIPCLILVRV